MISVPSLRILCVLAGRLKFPDQAFCFVFSPLSPNWVRVVVWPVSPSNKSGCRARLKGAANESTLKPFFFSSFPVVRWLTWRPDFLWRRRSVYGRFSVWQCGGDLSRHWTRCCICYRINNNYLPGPPIGVKSKVVRDMLQLQKKGKSLRFTGFLSICLEKIRVQPLYKYCVPLLIATGSCMEADCHTTKKQGPLNHSA